MKIGNFPEVVNDNAARIVALSVVILSVAALATHSPALPGILAASFAARVLYGPRFEPFAWLAVNVVVPRLGIANKPVAGPPKRFAQLIGLAFSLSGLGLLIAGQAFSFTIVFSILTFFAGLEAFLGFCAGCFAFGYLMKLGLVPDEICVRCNNLSFNK